MSPEIAPYEKNILPWAYGKGYEIGEPLWSEDLRLIQSVKLQLLRNQNPQSREEKLIRTLEELVCKYSLNIFERTIVMPFGKMTISYSSSNESPLVDNYSDLHNLYFKEPRRVTFSLETELGEEHSSWNMKEGEHEYLYSLTMRYLPGFAIPFECVMGDTEFEDKGSIFANISGYLSVIDSYAKNPDLLKDLISTDDDE